jgi:predicted nuclease with TOPRIM domain
MIEIIQTSAQVIGASALLFYAIDKKIVINKIDTELKEDLENQKIRTKNFVKTLQNMKIYQDKYMDSYSETILLKGKIKKLEDEKQELKNKLTEKDNAINESLKQVERLGLSKYKKGVNYD